MYQITVSEEIKNACPIFKGAAVYAEVTNTAFCEGLWEEINTFTRELTSTTQPEDVKLQPAIAATREAYKRCGKDPSRYRPSAEALRRRLMRGIALYRDAVGGIGTPTSDNERTKMDLGTQHILAIVNGYSGQEGLREAAEMIQELLKKYTSSNGGEIIYFE